VDGEIAEEIKNNNFKDDSLRYLKLKDTAISLFRDGQTSFNEILPYLI